jgi:hypothetical protein
VGFSSDYLGNPRASWRCAAQARAGRETRRRVPGKPRSGESVSANKE